MKAPATFIYETEINSRTNNLSGSENFNFLFCCCELKISNCHLFWAVISQRLNIINTSSDRELTEGGFRLWSGNFGSTQNPSLAVNYGHGLFIFIYGACSKKLMLHNRISRGNCCFWYAVWNLHLLQNILSYTE